jgi:hypothetical protein
VASTDEGEPTGVTDIKNCEQCGTVFTPRREHARFCSARCRMAWHGQNPGERTAEMSALDWSLAAMCEATGRLSSVQTWDRSRACWAVGDAVWWVTIVDATLVRYHPEPYDGVLARRATADRRLIEETLAGLRFVRNQMDSAVYQVNFVRPGVGQLDPGQRGICAWTWNYLPEPALASLPPRGQSWEMTRYRAYEGQLAGHRVGDTFTRAAGFLRMAVTRAVPVTDVAVNALS